jgi:phosphatidylserine/phosphatidylglycerophosphate/cardiolipin synthase-like enzyme
VSFISGAKRSVVVQDEVMGDQEVADALGERARAGVDVKVQAAKFEPNALGDTNAQLLKQLNAAGVTQVRFQRKPVLHAKLIVVDGEAAYLGSVNLTTNSLNNNRELGVIVREKAIVSKLVKFSTADWKAANQ